MRIAALILALCALLLDTGGARAAAAGAPVVAPTPAWVTPQPIPEASAALADRPLQILLLNNQSHYGKDGSVEYYVELATKVQTSQGLGALGNVVIPWQPDTSELLVHKIAILRDGKRIDLLGKGESFTVLRRENNLESAMLDGVLTAVLQPEGLTIGDVVEIAWTIREKPRAIALKAENVVLLPPPPFFARHAYYRETWDKGMAIRWRATPAMGKPRIKTGAEGSELIVDLSDAAGPKPPESAPVRFQLPASLEVSAYQDWPEIGRLFAPLYARAKVLAPDSPLRAEIARIAAASQDPAIRAMSALKLVQEKVRYLALAMGDGGYVPATADQTWTRKFGDCKGKTVLLLAILSELGIEAEPVLISSQLGDTLADRLPVVRLFDHVIVRAHIGGKSYWLDGTRIGDRRIESLASSPFGWSLPVTAAGSALEQLPLLPPTLPLQEMRITYDASKGFETPVPVTGEMLFRGDTATMLGLGMAQTSKPQFLEYMKGLTHGTASTEGIDQFDVKVDDAAGTLSLLFSGKVKMEWSKAPGSNAVRHQFDDDVIQWTPDFDRPADQSQRDAPFVFEFPTYLAATETVILPRHGQDFTIEGQALTQSVAGVEITRKLTLENGQAIARSSFRRLQRELSSAEAKAAEAALKLVNADRAYVRSPAGYRPSASERAAVLSSAPKSADDYLQRGYTYLQAFRLDEALADFDKAITLDPAKSRGYANRAVVLVSQRKFDLAKVALDKAVTLADDDFVTWQAYGLLHLGQGRPAEAVEALTRSLALDADNSFTLAKRIEAFEQLGRFDEAEADLTALARISSEPGLAVAEQARVAAFRNRPADALALADKWIAAKPNDQGPRAFKARLLRRMGRDGEAAPLLAEELSRFDKLIAVADADVRDSLRSARADLLAESGRTREAVETLDQLVRDHPVSLHYLNQRCWMRATANVQLPLALADCDKAMKLNASAAVVDSRGFVKLRLGRLDEAIADYDEAIRRSPGQAASYYGRGIARLRKGDRQAGEADLANARRLSFDIDIRFKEYGVQP